MGALIVVASYLGTNVGATVYFADIQLMGGSSALFNPQQAFLSLGLWFREGIKKHPSLQPFWISGVRIAHPISATFHFFFWSRRLPRLLPFINMAGLTKVPSLVTVAML